MKKIMELSEIDLRLVTKIAYNETRRILVDDETSLDPNVIKKAQLEREHFQISINK